MVWSKGGHGKIFRGLGGETEGGKRIDQKSGTREEKHIRVGELNTSGDTKTKTPVEKGNPKRSIKPGGISKPNSPCATKSDKKVGSGLGQHVRALKLE